MAEKPAVRFYLGANTPEGFYSLYDRFLDPAGLEDCFLLKGCPGCGKSTLMGRVAEEAERRGLAVEYVHCTGDPASLDAVRIPALRAVVADATRPHAAEPRCPLAVERYVDLSAGCDPALVKPRRAEIMDCMAGSKACYHRAYRCLRAARELTEDRRSLLLTPELEEKLRRRASGVLRRELKGQGREDGHGEERFLDAISCHGRLCRFDTAEALARKLWVLEDRFGLAHPFLQLLSEGARSRGWDVILCPDPLSPQRLRHLIVPGASLAFVTSAPTLPYEGRRPYRRLRLDAMVDPERLKAHRGRLRFSQKLSDSLLAEAIAAMGEGKALHDRLEAIYRPAVDFQAVEAAGDRILSALFPQ